MTLLRDIQNDAAYGRGKVSELLRKCRILAARLKSGELTAWVDRELNGYRDDEPLPEYRLLRGVESHGHFVGPARSELRNGRIPPHVLPPPFNEQITELHLNQPIAMYEDLAASAKGELHVDWPADLLAHVGRDIYDDMACIAAWRMLPRSSLVQLVDVVRNKVLALVLELEATNPNAGEASGPEPPISPPLVHQAFTTHIYGNVGNVATAGTNVTQNAQVIVARGDLAALRDQLGRIGVAAADVAELEAALAEDVKEPQPDIGRRAASWIGRMLLKVGSGAWQVSVQTAAEVLPKVIGSYLGLPPAS